MRSYLSFLFITVACASTATASESEADLQALNRKQAALTRQLNFAEKYADVHGRYVVVRERYLNGKEGLFQTTVEVFKGIDQWVSAWLPGMQYLTRGDWVNSVEDPRLMQFVERQHRAMQELTFKYGNLQSLAQKGYTLSSGLPRLSMAEFTKEKERELTEGIFIDAFEPNLKALNVQMDSMTSVFQDASALLEDQGVTEVLDQMKILHTSIYNNLKLLNSIKKMSFPELKNRIAAVDRMLGTEQAMNPIRSYALQLYESGLAHSSQADFLAAEATLKELEQFHAESFQEFEGNTNYDQERIQQAKALIRLQLSDLRSNLGNRIASEGGRPWALRSYIDKKSRKGKASPLTLCRAQGSRLSEYRHYFDCNLFRKNVAPFLSRLNEIDEGMLEVIARSLKNVYKGPLSVEASR